MPNLVYGPLSGPLVVATGIVIEIGALMFPYSGRALIDMLKSQGFLNKHLLRLGLFSYVASQLTWDCMYVLLSSTLTVPWNWESSRKCATLHYVLPSCDALKPSEKKHVWRVAYSILSVVAATDIGSVQSKPLIYDKSNWLRSTCGFRQLALETCLFFLPLPTLLMKGRK